MEYRIVSKIVISNYIFVERKSWFRWEAVARFYYENTTQIKECIKKAKKLIYELKRAEEK